MFIGLVSKQVKQKDDIKFNFYWWSVWPDNAIFEKFW